jgi:hypothetical protein
MWAVVLVTDPSLMNAQRVILVAHRPALDLLIYVLPVDCGRVPAVLQSCGVFGQTM